MFGFSTIRKDGVTITLDIISDASGSPVVNVKITDKKNRRIVVDTPANETKEDNSLAMPGGVYC